MIAARRNNLDLYIDYRGGIPMPGLGGRLKVRCGHLSLTTTYDAYEDGAPIQYDITVRAFYSRTGNSIQFVKFFASHPAVSPLMMAMTLEHSQLKLNLHILAVRELKARMSDFEEDPIWLIPPEIDNKEVGHPDFTKGT